MTLHVVLLSFLAGVLANDTTLSGTWRLDEARSELSSEAGLPGLIVTGVPVTLHVTHAKNGTLVVESQNNPTHARLYIPGRETTSPVVLGDTGRITVTSRWENGRLVSEGVYEITARTPTETVGLDESFRLSEDGRTLEIVITTTSDGSTHSSTLRYERIDSVGPCESWPSPCKTPPR